MQWAPPSFWAIGYFCLYPLLPISLIRGFWPVVAAALCAFLAESTPLGVIRPLLDLPYCGNWFIEKQKSHHFCNFFAIRDSFLIL